MNILVCVKQVPDTTQIKIDPVTNTLIREGVPAIMNTFDQFALEMALRYKATASDAKITVKDMNMTCVYKNVDSAADFEIPEEALKAQELTSDLLDDKE